MECVRHAQDVPRNSDARVGRKRARRSRERLIVVEMTASQTLESVGYNRHSRPRGFRPSVVRSSARWVKKLIFCGWAMLDVGSHDELHTQPWHLRFPLDVGMDLVKQSRGQVTTHAVLHRRPCISS